MKKYLFRRPESSPDVGDFCRSRRGWSGCWKRPRRLARIWIYSTRRSRARWMVGREFCRPTEEVTSLGSTEAAGGGGGGMSLLGLIGSCWWASGGWVMVFGGLNWSMGVRGRRWLVCGFLVRNLGRCLWCWVRAVVSCWSGAWGGWKGSVSVGCWVDFGMEWRSVQSGISGRMELGFCGGFQVVWSGVWVDLRSGRDEGDAGILGEFGGRIGRDFEGL